MINRKRENSGVSHQQIQRIIIATKPPGDIAYLQVYNHHFRFKFIKIMDTVLLKIQNLPFR